MFYVCNYLIKGYVRGSSHKFSHIWKVYKLCPLILLFSTYGFTYKISMLY